MSDRLYFCFCDSNCKFETMTKEQILAAIAEATGYTSVNVDDAFISKIKEQNKGGSVTIWRGTTAEYNALEERDENCIYIKTDDTALADIGEYCGQLYTNIQSVDTRLNETNDKFNYFKDNVGGVLLWSGAEQMGEESLISLAEAISDQPSGICLTFSPYENDTVQNHNFHHFFVPKQIVANHASKGTLFALHRYNLTSIGTKYLYIDDSSIQGLAANTAAGTAEATGVTYDNSKWVLRYVIGC